MKKNKLKINLLLQSFYQVLIVLTPLLTSPYVSRVLGAEKLGVYSFTYSIVNYFTIFANLGTQNYGSHAIASCGENRKERSKIFSEILCMQVGVSLLALVGYVIYLCFINTNDALISVLQTIYILVSLVSLNWFYFGLEEFRLTVLRNTIIKIVTIALIFTLVKKPEDLSLYIIILAGGDVVGQLVMIPALKKYVDFHIPTIRGVARHIKPNLILFLPGIAYSLNHVLDKTMIGVMSTYTQNGYYYNVEKIINIPKGLITGIGIVMMPHISKNISMGKNDLNKLYLSKFIYVVMFMACALSFGMSAVATEFVPFFFGPGYEGCIILMTTMAYALIFMSLSDTVRMQYLIPNNKDKVYAIALFSSAIFNVMINALLIPKLGALGAVIGTLVAEFIAFGIQFVATAVKVNILFDFVKALLFALDGVGMFLLIKWLSIHMTLNSTTVKLLIEIIVGGTVYVIVGCLILKIINPELFENIYLILKNMLGYKKRKDNRS